MSDYVFSNLQDIDLERQRLARRRRIAEQLIGTPMQEVQTKQFGDVMHVAGPTTAGLMGDAIARGFGQINLDAADEADRRMALDEARLIDASLASIPSAPGAQRQQAQLAAYVRGNPSLRKTLELQMGIDEKEAERIERGEQAAQNRVELAAEKEANRAFLGEQKELDRQNRLDVRAQPAVVIHQGGGRGATGIKAPPGYRYNEDGTALEPIPGGPKDPNAQPPKPLSQKDRDLQRGFMNLDSALATYEGLLNQYDPQGGSALSPTTRAALETAFTDVQMGMKSLYELGAPQAGDMRLLEQSFRNPTSIEGSVRGAAFGKEPFKAKVGQLRTLLNTSKANFEAQTGKPTPEAAKPTAGAGRTLVRSPAEFAALPAGTKWETLDGRKGTK